MTLTLLPTPTVRAKAAPALLPLEDGEQYRFAFAMDACVGCHSCEVACAEQNGTPVDKAWRRVGELEGGEFPNTRRFSLSIACNHCIEPTCLSGCPTNAYEKLANGIVTHHPDECVGCQYCMWNCPYEVPVFNEKHRIVSKCDMCKPRIEVGQSPACVLACPTHAISIETVNVAAWRADHAEADAPGLPPSDITLSTTRVTAASGIPAELRPVDEHRVVPQDPHWPLIVLTLLTQLSFGAAASAALLDLTTGGRGLRGATIAAFVAGAVALGASLLHLGKPTRALKALRNLRTSWLSREVALFSAFAALSFAYAFQPGLALLGCAAAVVGAAGVYASARLYLVPARPVWNSRRTPVAFFASAAATGPLLTLLFINRGSVPAVWAAVLIFVAAAGTVAQLGVQVHLMHVVRNRSDRQHRGTAELTLGPFHTLFLLRIFAAVAGLGLLVSTAATALDGAAAGGRLATALVVLGAGELAGRYLFYVTVVPYRIAGRFARSS